MITRYENLNPRDWNFELGSVAPTLFIFLENSIKSLGSLEKIGYVVKPKTHNFLARLHEVHRAIVVTSVVRVYVYVCVRVTLSVKVFKIAYEGPL